MLLLGESEVFGAKLPYDDDLCSAQLQRLLDLRDPGVWSVINGGIPGYNTHQFSLLWERLASELCIDVLLLRIGANDISQAYAMGDNWRPGAPWPIEFIRMLERRQPKSAHLLWWSCVWQTLRRARDDRAKARSFQAGQGAFQWEACRNQLHERIGSMVKDAQRRGIRVALLPPAPVFGAPPWDETEGRHLSALQSNWQAAIAGWGPALLELQTLLRGPWASAMDVPVIDLATPILAHPERIGLFLDLLHWSADGHHLIATLLEQGLLNLDWL